MIPEFGLFALILAFCFALMQCTLPCFFLRKNADLAFTVQRSSVVGQSLFMFLSFSVLVYAFITNDFSLSYVAENSNSHLPLIYKFTAIWGAHEGSLLLWMLIFNGWSLALFFWGKQLPQNTLLTLHITLGLLSSIFLLFILLTSNPFLRVLTDIPLEGRDLNPLLQDPGFVSHPPMLYMGYVGFAIAFAFAITALIEKRVDSTWARFAKPWVVAALSFLTAGITLGSLWAYRDLGWGGFWFWDPVENASLLPWLVGAALVHSLIVVEKRQLFQSWCVLLAIFAFSLSLIGTFLVRSGVLISVHAFANDPSRGLFILCFLIFIIGGSLTLYALRASSLHTEGSFTNSSREIFLLFNNIILMVCMLTVLLGTLYPLMLDVLHLGKISVGAPYFNSIMLPLFLLLMLVMGVGMHTHWQHTSLTLLMQRLRLPFVLSFFGGLLFPYFYNGHWSFLVSLGIGLAFWIILSTLESLRTHPKIKWGMTFAHLGIAITVIGITLSSAYSIEKDLRLSVGEETQVGPYAFHFQQLKTNDGPNYTSTQSTFLITHQNKTVTLLTPEKRIYTAQRMPLSQAAIHATLFRDLYIALGEALDENTWSVRIYYKPFVRWIWIGGGFIFLGGCFTLFSMYRRGKQHYA